MKNKLIPVILLTISFCIMLGLAIRNFNEPENQERQREQISQEDTVENNIVPRGNGSDPLSEYEWYDQTNPLIIATLINTSPQEDPDIEQDPETIPEESEDQEVLNTVYSLNENQIKKLLTPSQQELYREWKSEHIDSNGELRKGVDEETGQEFAEYFNIEL